MPDANNPLETALRTIIALVQADTGHELSISCKKYIRAEMVNCINRCSSEGFAAHSNGTTIVEKKP